MIKSLRLSQAFPARGAKGRCRLPLPSVRFLLSGTKHRDHRACPFVSGIRFISRVSQHDRDLRNVTRDRGSRFRYRTGHDDCDQRRDAGRRSRAIARIACPDAAAARRIRAGDAGEAFETGRRRPPAQRITIRPLGAPKGHVIADDRVAVADNKTSLSARSGCWSRRRIRR